MSELVNNKEESSHTPNNPIPTMGEIHSSASSNEGGSESSLTASIVGKKKEIYTYEAPWTVYSMAWRRRPEGKFQLAIGSFVEEYVNQIQILQISKDEVTGETNCTKFGQCDHPYPPTKILWAPPKFNLSSAGSNTNIVDCFATSGDYLRIWNVNSDYTVTMKGVLNNNKHAEYCAPLTGFDWNETEPSMIGSCSIDTTCTIWDCVVCLLPFSPFSCSSRPPC
jgi:WD repeat-containing protein 68